MRQYEGDKVGDQAQSNQSYSPDVTSVLCSTKGVTLSVSDVDNPGAFYTRALERIRLCMVGLAILLTTAAYLRFGWQPAMGFALGCGVAYLNFHWLKHVIQAMADRITLSKTRESARGIVVRFVLRYCLFGAGCYVILSGWPAGLSAFLAGLALPVAAITCEAIYEAYLAVADKDLVDF
jgi:hypothetical protein